MHTHSNTCCASFCFPSHFFFPPPQVHHFSEEEKAAFVAHINFSLQGDKDLGGVLPISASGNDLFTKCFDGILLCKLINSAVPGTIDDRVINRGKGGKKLDLWSAAENSNLAINSAASIGKFLFLFLSTFFLILRGKRLHCRQHWCTGYSGRNPPHYLGSYLADYPYRIVGQRLFDGSS